MRHKHYVYTLSIWQSMLQINLEKDTLLRLHSIIDFLWDCQLSRTAARNSSCLVPVVRPAQRYRLLCRQGWAMDKEQYSILTGSQVD